MTELFFIIRDNYCLKDIHGKAVSPIFKIQKELFDWMDVNNYKIVSSSDVEEEDYFRMYKNYPKGENASYGHFARRRNGS